MYLQNMIDVMLDVRELLGHAESPLKITHRNIV